MTLTVWHVGAASSSNVVDGINTSLWLLASEQARMGLRVVLLLGAPPRQDVRTLAEESGLTLVHVPGNAVTFEKTALQTILAEYPPDLVHMHSVFIPKQAFLARELRRRKIPYIIKPGGGVAPEVLLRGRLKKSLYSLLLERPRFRSAAAIVSVTPGELGTVRAFIPGFSGIMRWLPNPVATHKSEIPWNPAKNPHRLVFLGRFDVTGKGLDILVQIGRFLPEAEVHLYGSEDHRMISELRVLKESRPPNVFFHAPVYGEEKARVLAEASLYIQTSRWEAFGNSVAEAMLAGVPCAIAETMNLAEIFAQHDLGIVLSIDPKLAAQSLSQALQSPDRLRAWAASGQAFAQEHFEPQNAAQRYLELYQEVLGGTVR